VRQHSVSKVKAAVTSHKKSAPPLRKWRVSLIRKHGQVLRAVEAPNREAAEAAAVQSLGLNKEQRSRLVVQERI
jgi:hypothetical protein